MVADAHATFHAKLGDVDNFAGYLDVFRGFLDGKFHDAGKNVRLLNWLDDVDRLVDSNPCQKVDLFLKT